MKVDPSLVEEDSVLVREDVCLAHDDCFLADVGGMHFQVGGIVGHGDERICHDYTEDTFLV